MIWVLPGGFFVWDGGIITVKRKVEMAGHECRKSKPTAKERQELERRMEGCGLKKVTLHDQNGELRGWVFDGCFI
jgi:hypothetical protein